MNKKILAGVIGSALVVAGGASWAAADTSVGPVAAEVTLVEGSTTYSYMDSNGYHSDTIACPTGTFYLTGAIYAPGQVPVDGPPIFSNATYDPTTGLVTGVYMRSWEDTASGDVNYYIACITLPS